MRNSDICSLNVKRRVYFNLEDKENLYRKGEILSVWKVDIQKKCVFGNRNRAANIEPDWSVLPIPCGLDIGK